MRVIPAVDIRDGCCVRLFQGEFDQETRYSADPAGVARSFADLGAVDLHIVDLDGARGGQQKNQASVRRITTESPLAVQLGGGIRDRATIADWLDSGVARCVIGSQAVVDPKAAGDWCDEFGAERMVFALDVRITSDGIPLIATHGWERTSSSSLWDYVEHFGAHRITHLLCTDVSRDGAMSGPNLGLYGEIVRRYPNIELQASGGVRNIADLEALRSCGVAAAITGRALLDGAITAEEVRLFLRDE